MRDAKQVKKHFFEEYGGFADKRLKNLDKGDTFIADDRSRRDVGADGQLYSYFCLIFVRVDSGEFVEVTLRGNIPMSDSVQEWIDETGASLSGSFQPSLSFEIRIGEEDRLRDLADRIEGITAPGARYAVANYKYVCPRTAASLRRVASTLESLG